MKNGNQLISVAYLMKTKKYQQLEVCYFLDHLPSWAREELAQIFDCGLCSSEWVKDMKDLNFAKGCY